MGRGWAIAGFEMNLEKLQTVSAVGSEFGVIRKRVSFPSMQRNKPLKGPHASINEQKICLGLCSSKISHGFFNSFAGILCEAMGSVNFVFRKGFKAGGIPQNKQLIVKSVAVFTHRKMEPYQKTIKKGKVPIH